LGTGSLPSATIPAAEPLGSRLEERFQRDIANRYDFIVPTTEPILAPIIRRRVFAGALGLIGVAQVIATLMRFPGWPCPLLHATGIPCPGCGLSRACAELLRGHGRHAVTVHAFAPVAVAAIVLLVVATILPANARSSLANTVERAEKRSAIPALLLILLIIYWIMRLVYFRGPSGLAAMLGE
jgi:hypothetical protein